MSALGNRDAAARKNAPIARGVLWYFPNACDALLADAEQGIASNVLSVPRLLAFLHGDPRVMATRLAERALEILIDETGSLWAAMAAVAEVSMKGAVQHCGGVLGWAREKSTDHADCIVRHYADRGTVDTDGGLHSAKVLWRALALLETILDPRPEDGQPWSPKAEA